MNPFAYWFLSTLPEKTPEEILSERLAVRKSLRIAQQERARIAHWKKQKKIHANDPLIAGAK